MTIAFTIIVLIVVLVLYFRQNKADKGSMYRKNMLDQDVFSERNSFTESSDYTQGYDEALHRESVAGSVHHTHHTAQDAFVHSSSLHDAHSHSNQDGWEHAVDSGSFDSTPSDSTSFDSHSSSID